MRLLTHVDKIAPDKAAKVKEFAEWLLKIGSGEANKDEGVSDLIKVHPTFLLRPGCRNRLGLICVVYPDIGLECAENNLLEYCQAHAVLAARNVDIDELNSAVLQELPGEVRTFLSADDLGDLEDATCHSYPTEYLNSLTITGMPLHKTTLKSWLSCPPPLQSRHQH